MTDIELYQPRAEVAAREPHRDIDSWIQVVADVIKIANVICDTPFVPDGLRGSAPAVAAAILSGREMGLGMMTSLANIDVIRGKPTQKPLLMRAMILERGHKWIDVEVSDYRAVVRGCRRGESEWTEVTFTADQAKKAGLNLGNYPADKLYARASSRLAKRRFADVIMGMPYTPDDVEDGVADDEIGTVTEVTGQPAAIESAKPRTAQRRTRTQTAPSAPAAPASPPQAAAATPTGTDGALPPLPGEEDPDPTSAPPPGTASPPSSSAPDERDHNSPGTVTTPQIKAIWTVLSTVYHFSKEEKDQARAVCAHIIGHDLESTTEMSRNQAKVVLDTLSHWQHQAANKGEDPRDYLIAVMVAQDTADGEAADAR